MDRTARAAASASNRVTSGSATTRFVATLSFAAFFAVTGADAGELAIYNWAD